MKDIKFRAWNKTISTMWNFDAIERNKVFALDSKLPSKDFLVIPNGNEIELMQFTGLVDKQGVEIYENDLAKINGRIYQVIYLNSAYGFVDVKSGDFWQYACNLATSSFGEVIGNIYENAELLNKDKQ